MFRTIFPVLGVFLLIISCNSSEKKSEYRADSSGAISQITVFSDEQVYQTLEPHLMDSLLLGQIFPGLYFPPEYMFSIRHFDSKDLNDFKRTRSVLSIKKGEPSILFEKDKYSRPQAFVEVSGNNTNQILQLLRKNKDSLISFYRNADKAFTLKYARKKTHDLTPQLEEMGVTMLVPNDYKLAQSEKNFVWYRKDQYNTIYNVDEKGGETPDQSQDILNLMFYKVPFGKAKITTEDVIALRDSIGKLYTKGGKEPQEVFIGKDSIRAVVTDHIQTEMNPMLSDFYDTTLIQKTDSLDRYESYGYWSMTLSQMGGPYSLRLILDKKNHELYVAEAFIFAPLNNGKSKKRDYLTQFDGLFTTFNLIQEKEED